VLSGSIFEYCTNKFRLDSLGSLARKYYWPKEQSEEQCKEQVYLSNRTMFSDVKNAAAAFDTAPISKHKAGLTVKANTNLSLRWPVRRGFINIFHVPLGNPPSTSF
jgi:hypothetical protein